MIMPMIMSMTSEFKCVSISNCDAFGGLLGDHLEAFGKHFELILRPRGALEALVPLRGRLAHFRPPHFGSFWKPFSEVFEIFWQ